MFIRVQAYVWYNLEHHTTCGNDYTAGESNVCRIRGNHRLIWTRANFKCQKKLFSNLDETPVLARRIISSHFLYKLYICKMFIRVQANVWYNLEDHTTRRNDYTTG